MGKFLANGKTLVTVAGTPVQLATSGYQPIHAFLIEVLPTNTGRIYVGLAGMNKTTFVGVLAILAVPTANLLPTFSAAITIAPNGLHMEDLWIDAEVNGEGIIFSGIEA